MKDIKDYLKHLGKTGMSELEGWEWFDNVTRVISAEKVLELDKTAIPLRLQRWAKQLKSVQLKLF